MKLKKGDLVVECINTRDCFGIVVEVFPEGDGMSTKTFWQRGDWSNHFADFLLKVIRDDKSIIRYRQIDKDGNIKER